MSLIDRLAVRVDCAKSQAKIISGKINGYFKVKKFLWVFEISKEVKKPHIHGLLIIDPISLKSMDTGRRWMSRQKDINTGKGSFSLSQVKDLDKYKAYLMKDLDPFDYNLTDEEMEQLYEEATRINIEKHEPMVSKLFHNITGSYIGDWEDGSRFVIDDREVLEKCLEYFKDRKLLHPTKTQMFQYVSTILSITGNDTSVFASYYDMFISKNFNSSHKPLRNKKGLKK